MFCYLHEGNKTSKTLTRRMLSQVHSSTTYSSQHTATTRMSIYKRTDEEAGCLYTYNGVLLGHQKSQATSVICGDREGPWGHNAKCNSETEKDKDCMISYSKMCKILRRGILKRKKLNSQKKTWGGGQREGEWRQARGSRCEVPLWDQLWGPAVGWTAGWPHAALLWGTGGSGSQT